MEPGKRIVSKGEYAKVQGKRAGAIVGGAYLLLTCLLCALMACLSGLYALVLAVGVAAQAVGIGIPRLENVVSMCLFAAITAAFGMGCRVTANLYKNAVKMLRDTRNVVPLTRATAADLPANDSLVRASQEPEQAQAGVLLRAASEQAQAGREDQLLRASVGGPE